MSKSKTKKAQELDTIYFLKMLIYLVLGSMWLRISFKSGTEVPIPLGLLLGLYLASKEKLQIDRKLEYAILLMSMFIGFWLPIGIVIST